MNRIIDTLWRRIGDRVMCRVIDIRRKDDGTVHVCKRFAICKYHWQDIDTFTQQYACVDKRYPQTSAERQGEEDSRPT